MIEDNKKYGQFPLIMRMEGYNYKIPGDYKTYNYVNCTYLLKSIEIAIWYNDIPP